MLKHITLPLLVATTLLGACTKHVTCDSANERMRQCGDLPAPGYTTFKGFTAAELDTVWLYVLDANDNVVGQGVLYSSLPGAADYARQITQVGNGDYRAMNGVYYQGNYRMEVPATGTVYHINNVQGTMQYCTVCGVKEQNGYLYTGYSENGQQKSTTDERGSITLQR